MANLMPAIFLGHGNPMNALAHNSYTEAWAALGANFPRPKAVLCISAHWYTAGSALTVNTAPKTIHDFGGFPHELYQVDYPAPGDAELARRVQKLLAPQPVELSEEWGLDHGTWSVLKHVYPAADVPVVQLSIDRVRTAPFHYEIGQRLAQLREEGVLILGSGNLVHNLRAYAWGGVIDPYDWAKRFEDQARELVLARDHRALVEYPQMGSDAMRSIPTPEHYLPLLYVLGTSLEKDLITFPVEGIEGGSISMLAVQAG